MSKYLFLIFMGCLIFTCRKPFQPALKNVAINNLLVVDGVINTVPGGITTINLSRARSLTDSTYSILPENNASVSIESSSGAHYPLVQTTGSAVYASGPLNLNNSLTYRVHVTTSGGGQYLSDFVLPKPSPPVDSITWQPDNDVNIYVSTHDATNNTRYYRWDFIETWQHDARYNTTYGVYNGLIFSLDSTNSTYHCWTNDNSGNIILGTSVALTQDIISQQPITTIPQDDPKIGVRYSILVRQYALTQQAYQYWQIIQKNTQNIGTLFDVQPSQLFGNVTSVANKDEPVIGYISAGTVQEKRIFINNADLANWAIPTEGEHCDLVNIPQNPQNFLLYNYPDTSFAPYYFTTFPSGLNITKKDCLDCRRQGGTNVKPSFWQ